MYFNLDYIEMADSIYVYNEVDFKIYKIHDELWNKLKKNTKDYNDYRLELKRYLVKKGVINNDVIYDRIMDCSEAVDIDELFFNAENKENIEISDRVCDKYHLLNCKRKIKVRERICDSEIECKDYTFEEILRVLFWGEKCKYTDDMIDRLKSSWDKIKENILNNTVTIEDNKCIKHVFEMIENQKTRMFPCDWGMNKLYIENGILYNCDQKYKKKLRINSLNSVLSVDEYEPCKLCWARYICGGVCDREIIKTGKYCKLVCDVFCTLLKIYIIKKPEKIIHLA